MSDGSSSALKVLAVVLLIAGLAALAVGIVYFTVAANELPSFLGKLSHNTGHRNKRGVAAAAVGVILIAGSALAFWRSRSRRW
jgi:hypothetical protein